MKTMLLVGVCDVSDSTNVFMAKAFRRLGWNVIPINYRTILRCHSADVFSTALLNVLEITNPDFILFSKCNGIDSLLVGDCGKYSKTWYWFMDPLATLMQLPECVEHARMADYVSCTGLHVVEYLSNHIGKDVYHIPEGVDPEYYRPSMADKKYRADISFIGTATPHRKQVIDLLIKHKFNVKSYGDGFGRYIKGEEFSKVCASSSIMLSLDNEVGRGYFSDRILRYGACGSCVLHRYSPAIDKYFTEDEICYFSDASSLLKNAKKLLAFDRKKREDMKTKLRDKVISNFTWEHSCRKILEIIRERDESEVHS